MSIAPAAEQSTRVGEIMTTRLTTIGPQQQLSFAHALMMWSNVRHLPVTQDDALLGLLSDRDLLSYLHTNRDVAGTSTTVRDAMSFPAPTITPADQLADAAARMALQRIDCLCVVDQTRLVGLVTTTDVLAERGRLFFHGSHPAAVPDTSTVMQPTVAVTHNDDLLFDAIVVMLQKNIRHLPVIDAERRVIGMLSDRDIRARVGDPLSAIREPKQELISAQVGEVMSRTPMMAGPQTPLVDLARAFLDERVGALPVIDAEDRLVGIVSYVDLLRHVVAARG